MARPDIFLSYSRQDGEQAGRFARALGEAGFDVWWDMALQAGETYDEVTEAALRGARIVLVLWSPRSVASRWVRSEASIGQRNGTLVPVMIEPCERPVMFELMQTADLCGWHGKPDDPAWRALVAGLAQRLDKPPAEAGTTAPAAAPPRVTGNLPQPGTALLGRDADLAELVEHLGRAPVVTLVGPGGIGKTRLLLALGEALRADFPDGVWFVELATLAAGGNPVEAIAAAMQIDLGPAGTAEALADRLRRRASLILLDNCEHVVAEVAPLVAAIAAMAPQVRIAASSQEPLQLAAEQVYRLNPLTNAAGAALFAAHLARLDPGWQAAAGDGGAVAALVEALDGMPLAIEMAAAWVPALGLDQVRALLTQRLDVLSSRRRDGHARHQTLRNTLEWSHKLLGEAEARLFRRLGVFHGSFAIEAVAALDGEGPLAMIAAAEAMTNLVAKSLVVSVPQAGRARYRLFSTVRLYAQEQLAAAGEEQAIRTRHGEWLAAFMAPAWHDFAGMASDGQFAARFAGEVDNVRGVIDWAYGPGQAPALGDELLANSSVTLPEPYLLRLHMALAPRLDLPEDHAMAIAPAARARILVSRAHVFVRIKPDLALAAAEQALAALAAQAADPWLAIDALSSKGFALWLMGRLDEAQAVAESIAAQVPPGAVSRISAQTCGLRASLAGSRGEMETMHALFDEAIGQLRAIGANGLASFWRMTALRFLPEADRDAAITAWEQLLAEIDPAQMYADFVRSQAMTDLAWLLATRDAAPDRARLHSLAGEFFRTSGTRGEPGFCLAIARAGLAAGAGEEAARLLGYGQSGNPALQPPTERRQITLLRDQLSAALGPARIAVLEREGAALGAEQAAERAMRLLDQARQGTRAEAPA